MNLQEIIVGILIVGCFGWIIRRIYQIIKEIKGKTPPTCGCGCSDCPIAGKCQNEKNSDFLKIFHRNACRFKK